MEKYLTEHVYHACGGGRERIIYFETNRWLFLRLWIKTGRCTFYLSQGRQSMMFDRSMEQTDNTTEDEDISADDFIPVMVRFWMILPVLIPSVICSVLLLIHLFRIKTTRHALHHHVIIVLLFLSLLNIHGSIVFSLIYYPLGVVWPQSPLACKFFIFSDYGTYSAALIFMAWASFERHLLVFHERLFVTQMKRRIWHYTPLGGISLYLTVYYIYFMFFYPCEEEFDYHVDECGAWPCFLNNRAHAIFHNFCHGLLPVLLIVLFSVGLFIRVVRHRRRLNQPLPWRKQRTMVIQILVISTLYSIVNLPMMLVATLRQAGLRGYGEKATNIFFFLCVYVIMLLPFVSIRLIPSAWDCLMSRLCRAKKTAEAKTVAVQLRT